MRRITNFFFSQVSAADSARLLAAIPGVAALGPPRADRDPSARRFEAAWRERFSAADAVVFPSARSGLLAVLKSFRVGDGDGDEVIMTGFTCLAAVLPVLYAGAKPVFGDVDSKHANLGPEEAERLIGPNTRAIVIQHTLGFSADVEPLVALARRRGLAVIEDSALALGSQRHGKQLGSFADAAIFSFELSKTISAGWGGVVQANSESLGRRLRSVRAQYGRLARPAAARRLLQAGLSGVFYRPALVRVFGYPMAALFRFGVFGYSTRPPEQALRGPERGFAAAQASAHWSVLTRQLGQLDAIRSHHRATAERYEQVLTAHGIGRVLPEHDDGTRLIRFPLQVHSPGRMTAAFARRGIEIGRWFDHPVSPPPKDLSAINYVPGSCPVGERVGRHIVNLPLHTRMSEGDVATACDALDAYLTANPEERDFVAQALQ